VEGDEVWVAETWQAYGYGHEVQGVYGSREAAFEGLKGEPDMTVYADGILLRARPRHEDASGARWGVARCMTVRGRAAARPA
jgi:hypothetical protein